MPVSLDQALCNTFVGKGTLDNFPPLGNANGEEDLHRVPQEMRLGQGSGQLSSSSEDETDGNFTNEVDEEGVEIGGSSSRRLREGEGEGEGKEGVRLEGKGKGKEKERWIPSGGRNDSEIPLEDLLDCTA